MGKDSPSAPPPRDLSGEINQILSQGPAMLRSQTQLAPGYTSLQLGQMGSYLNGTPSAPGALSLYSGALPQITAANSAANTAARTATGLDIGSLGPQFTSAIKSLNPGGAGIMDQLTKTATEGVNAGNTLTPAQQAALNNSVRSAQGARGISYGPASAYQEVLQNSQYGDQLQQQRQQQGASVAQLGNYMYSAPALAALTGTGAPVGQAQGFLGSSGGVANNGNTFATLGGYASDLNNTNYNAQAAQNINAANANNAEMGNIAKLGGSVLGAVAPALLSLI